MFYGDFEEEFDDVEKERILNYIKRRREDMRSIEEFLRKCPNPPEGTLMIIEHSEEVFYHPQHAGICSYIFIRSFKNSKGEIYHKLFYREYDTYDSTRCEFVIAEL